MLSTHDIVLADSCGPVTAKERDFANKVNVLAEIVQTLLVLGATVELAQFSHEHFRTGTFGTITKVNGIGVEFEFRYLSEHRWDSSPKEFTHLKVSADYHHEFPTASYPAFVGRPNIEKLAQRLHAVTAAAAIAAKKKNGERNRAAQNSAALQKICKERYGSEYSSDYKRNITLDSDAEGFTVKLSRRAKTPEALVKLLTDLEKFLDDRSAGGGQKG